MHAWLIICGACNYGLITIPNSESFSPKALKKVSDLRHHNMQIVKWVVEAESQSHVEHKALIKRSQIK